VEIMHDNKVAARHTRCYGRGHEILDLEHYLDVLERKPGAMKGSTPLQQWRQAGRWPACLDAIWRELEQRHGKSKGTREMIALVRAGAGDGWDKLIAAVKDALRLGISDPPPCCICCVCLIRNSAASTPFPWPKNCNSTSGPCL
jgi:hypothetical protein